MCNDDVHEVAVTGLHTRIHVRTQTGTLCTRDEGERGGGRK